MWVGNDDTKIHHELHAFLQYFQPAVLKNNLSPCPSRSMNESCLTGGRVPVTAAGLTQKFSTFNWNSLWKKSLVVLCSQQNIQEEDTSKCLHLVTSTPCCRHLFRLFYSNQNLWSSLHHKDIHCQREVYYLEKQTILSAGKQEIQLRIR